MPPAVDRQHQPGVLQPVEAQRLGGGDHHPAVDQPPAGRVLGALILVEVDLGGVLIEARGHLVLGLLDGHAVDMVDLLADCVVLERMRRACEGEVVAAEVEAVRQDQVLRRHGAGQGRRRLLRDLGGLAALAHHHPTHIAQHRLAVLVLAGGADIDHAGLAVGVLLQPDDLAGRDHRVARIQRLEKQPLGVAQVGHGVQADVRHGLAEDHVEGDQRIDRRAAQAAGPGELVRRGQGETRAMEGVVQRHVPGGDRARRGVGQHLPQPEVLEIVAGVGLGHGVLRFAIVRPSRRPSGSSG